jgi:hypothetical protein
VSLICLLHNAFHGLVIVNLCQVKYRKSANPLFHSIFGRDCGLHYALDQVTQRLAQMVETVTGLDCIQIVSAAGTVMISNPTAVLTSNSGASKYPASKRRLTTYGPTTSGIRFLLTHT